MGFSPTENRPIVWVEPCNCCRGWVSAAFEKLKPDFRVLPPLVWLSSSDELIAWLCAAEVDARETVPLLIVLRGEIRPIATIQLLGNLKSSPWRFIPVIIVVDGVNLVVIDQLWDSGADSVVLLTGDFWALVADLRVILKFYELAQLPSIGRLHGLTGPKRIRKLRNAEPANPAD